jgi:hypothetical protein
MQSSLVYVFQLSEEPAASIVIINIYNDDDDDDDVDGVRCFFIIITVRVEDGMASHLRIWASSNNT